MFSFSVYRLAAGLAAAVRRCDESRERIRTTSWDWRSDIRQRYHEAVAVEQMITIAVANVTELQLVAATMMDRLTAGEIVDREELHSKLAGPLADGAERSNGMAGSGTGFMGNYIRGSEGLYNRVLDRRDRYRDRRDEVEATQNEMEAILEDIAELKLVVATMVNLLVTKKVLDEEELLKYGKIIDAMDGKVDGKFHGSIEPDGTLTPDKPAPRSELDDLADAVGEAGG